MPAEEEQSASEPGRVNIVRYPNRRLYDRSQGRYVTLPEIATMVRAGKTIQVRDSKTNDDLTSIILTQIILEQHPERMELLPVPILHLMLRTNDAVLGLLREYFHQSLGYVEFWERAAAFNPMAASLNLLKTFLPATGTGSGGVGTDTAPPPSQPPKAEEAPPPPLDAQVLAERLAEMERRLNALDSSAGGSAGEEGRRSGKKRGRRGERD